MTGNAVLVAEDGLPTDAWFQISLAPLLLRDGMGTGDEVLRIHTPRPTAAFSQRDTRQPGFPRAVRAAHELGFVPVVRPQGGLLAAYHEGSVLVDHIVRAGNPHAGITSRFEHYAALHASALARLGVASRIGALAGEYCPGEFSLNVEGQLKVAGSAQRVTKDGWILSTVVQVTGSDRLRKVLRVAYDALGYELDQATVGALDDFIALSVSDVRCAMHAAHTGPRATTERIPTSLVTQTAIEAASLATAYDMTPHDAPRLDSASSSTP